MWGDAEAVVGRRATAHPGHPIAMATHSRRCAHTASRSRRCCVCLHSNCCVYIVLVVCMGGPQRIPLDDKTHHMHQTTHQPVTGWRSGKEHGSCIQVHSWYHITCTHTQTDRQTEKCTMGSPDSSECRQPLNQSDNGQSHLQQLLIT